MSRAAVWHSYPALSTPTTVRLPFRSHLRGDRRRTPREWSFIVSVVAFGVLLLGAMLLARVNASAADETRSAFGWATHTLMVENLFRETLAELTEAESSQRGFLLTGDEVYAYSFAPAADSVGRLVATLRMLTVDNPEQQRRLDTLQRLIARRLTLLRTIAALTRAGHRDSAIRI